MPSSATLALFSTAVLLLLLAPGPNMAFVLIHGARYGWRGAIHIALGIGAADIVLTLLIAAGLGLFFLHSPLAQSCVRLMGAAYLFYLAWRAWTPARLTAAEAVPLLAARALWGRAFLNSLLNPKAVLFFALFLPQFVAAGRAPAATQLVVLGIWLTMLSVLFHALLGMAGSLMCRWIAPGGHGRPAIARLTAAILAMLGCICLLR